jgi:hypothetical protein
MGFKAKSFRGSSAPFVASDFEPTSEKKLILVVICQDGCEGASQNTSTWRFVVHNDARSKVLIMID